MSERRFTLPGETLIVFLAGPLAALATIAIAQPSLSASLQVLEAGSWLGVAGASFWAFIAMIQR